ncbi:MAG TPA: hypothetical protein VGR94_07070 [Candidatus Acidoferrales bacterium]|nr:hypothetical protein [Candidatus Acidoferrales bacterium]
MSFGEEWLPRSNRVNKRQKKAKSRRNGNSPQKGAAQIPPRKLSRWDVLLGAVAVVGFCLTVYTLFPRVTVQPGAPLKTSDPFGTTLVFSNDGYFAVIDVEFSCKMNFEDANQNIFANDTESNSAYSVSRLNPKEETTVGCNFPSPGLQSLRTAAPILRADATINASFRGSFIPWRTERSFKFQAAKDSNGEFHWIPVATTK